MIPYCDILGCVGGPGSGRGGAGGLVCTLGPRSQVSQVLGPGLLATVFRRVRSNRASEGTTADKSRRLFGGWRQ